MKYSQLDRLISLEPGKKLVGERTMHADEEYLKDHFPNFPVMPGVMMLEAIVQAAIWMIRAGDDFKWPLVMVREVRNVKFGDFLGPGDSLEVTVELVKREGEVFTVKGSAEKNGRTTVAARLVLENQVTGHPDRIGTDALVAFHNRDKFEKLFNRQMNSI